MTTSTKPVRPSFSDAYEGLNWHDEQAIEKAFDADIHDLMQQFASGKAGIKGMVRIVRAFELAAARREGASDAEALDAVRKLTTGEVTSLLDAYLASEADEEPVPDEPVTEAGKDDSPVE